MHDIAQLAPAHRDGDGDPFPAELAVWLSPMFPVGGFAFSHGLETAVADGAVTGRQSLTDWLTDVLAHGALWNDLVLLAAAYRAAHCDALVDVAALAAALQPSAERRMEALAQGQGFREAYLDGWCTPPGAREASRFTWLASVAPTYAIAVGVAAGERQLPLGATLQAFAVATLANLVSAAIRLGVGGQVAGQRVLADMMYDIRRIAREALAASLDDLGGAVFAADIAAMRHETQPVRLFRS